MFLNHKHKKWGVEGLWENQTCVLATRTEFPKSAVSESAQDVPELVSFCRQ